MEADKDRSVEELQSELDDIRQSTMQMLRNFVDKQPERFVTCLCEATLGVRDENNPFTVMEQASNVYRLENKHLAAFATMILQKTGARKSESKFDGFCPFSKIVWSDFFFFRDIDGEKIIKSSNLREIQHEYFESQSFVLASAIDSACLLVFEGLPLYHRVNDEDRLERLSFGDPLFLYIYKKGEFFETGQTIYVPEWIDGLYFKESDRETHKAFFSGAGNLLSSERDLRRSALRQALGLDAPQVHLAHDQDVSSLKLEIDRLTQDLQAANTKIGSLEADMLKGKARATSLKLIGGLAMVGAELDIYSGKFEGITDVIRDLAVKGVSVTDDTLRDYLQQAAKVIGSKSA
ncbi:hypothetical protein [Paraburkholderia phosphatilytica]|uniref:hypothetical protein n=1 Tax=Paraburkholderia phosphatilytica TaxID=2282883 RepID=UPI000E4A3767|nr:hypothetical protein [Paraburkholderia phosphatilytica]